MQLFYFLTQFYIIHFSKMKAKNASLFYFKGKIAFFAGNNHFQRFHPFKGQITEQRVLKR